MTPTCTETDSSSATAVGLLHSNQRLVTLNFIIGVLLAVGGLCIALLMQSWYLQAIGSIIALGGTVALWFAWQFSTHPRVAITDTELWVYVSQHVGQPTRIPLDAVEVFFIGQGAVKGPEPGQPHGYEGAVAANVVVRLAESAKEWHEREAHQLLGIWNEGYITVRGLFCNNIDQDVLKDMNRQLIDRKRKLRESRSATT